MSFWGNIFGTSEATNSMVNAAVDGLDKLIYTDEEKAEDVAKRNQAMQSFLIGWMETTKGQNIARRLLALIMTSVWLLQFLGSQILSIAAIWSDNPDRLLKSAEVINGNIEQMTGAVMLILAFYFAAPHMGSIVQSAIGKFGGVK